MANNIDFILRHGLQVASNVTVGAYSGVNAAPVNGMIVSGWVGIGSASPTSSLTVTGNVTLFDGATPGGIVFPDGTWQETAASASAAGVLGSVQFNNGSGYFDYDEFFLWDTANNRLGIGTSLPLGTLHVEGPTPALFNTLNASNPEVIVGLDLTTSGVSLGYNVGTDFGFLKATPTGNDKLRWNTQGVSVGGVVPNNALAINGNVVVGNSIDYAGVITAPAYGMIVQGAVGIGSTGATTAKLDIHPGSNVPGLLVKTPASNAADFLRFVDSSDAAKFTINKDGNVTVGGWNGSVINANYGGTGQSSYTSGDMLYATASTSTLSKLGIGSTGNILVVSGGAPSWGTIDLSSASAVGTSLLGLANGGTNASLTASNGGIVYSGASAFAVLSASATSGNVLISGGAGAPTWGYSYSSSNDPNTLVARDSSGNFTAGTITAATGLTVTTGGATISGYTQVTGNVGITGNLMVTGTITTVNSNVLVLEDPLVYVGDNNPADMWDLGVVGSYNDGTYQHTGIVRNHNDGTWSVFDSVITEPDMIIDWSQATYGDFKTGTINVAVATASTSTTTGAIITAGGAGIAGQATVGGNVALTTNGKGIVFPDNTFQTTAFTSASAVTSFTTNLDGLTPNTATTGAVTLSGTLGVANGGIGTTTLTSYGIVYGNGTGAVGVTAAGTTGNVLIATTGSAASWGKVGLTTHVDGTLAVGNGGTGLTSYTTGDIVYASSGSTLASLADIATGNVLLSGGVGVAPSYGKVGLTTHIDGTLAVGNGGTGLTSYTIGDIVYANTTSSLTTLADIATGNVLLSGGAGTAPSYGKVGLTTHVDGTLPLANGGTNNGSLTASAGAVIYGDGTKLNETTVGESGNVLVSGGTGSPTWGINISSTNVGNTIVSRTATGNIAVAGASVTTLQATQVATVQTLVSNTTVSGNSFVIGGGVTTTSVADPITVDTLSLDDFRTVHYIAQVTDDSLSHYMATQFMIIHDGSSAYKSEYNIMWTVASLGSFDASVAGGNMTVTFTASSATAKTIKLVRTSIAK